MGHASKTPSQLSGSVWRNNRIVGYQGESSRCSNQRQSGTEGTANQTGTPRAPARWAGAEIAGDDDVQVAHDGGGIGKILQIAAQVDNRKTIGQLRQMLGRGACLQTEEMDVVEPSQWGEFASGMERLKSLRLAGLPCQTIPIFSPDIARAFSPVLDKLGLHVQVGHAGRHCRQGRFEDGRQAQQESLNGEVLHRQSRFEWNHLVDGGTGGQDACQRRLAYDDDPATPFLHHGRHSV